MQHFSAISNEPVTSDEVFLNWTQACSAGVHKVGGKAWNLGRLHQYGFDVPCGGVIPVWVYELFIHHNGLNSTLETVNTTASLQNLSDASVKRRVKHLCDDIVNGSFPEDFVHALKNRLAYLNLLNQPVAVRSSATLEDSAKASFAGIHDSFLNVNGFDNILHAIKACFASVWTARAITYRRKMGIDDSQVRPAVILMKMVDADAAGVAFTCDPATGREDVCLVNANFGLGESVVNGGVEPDTYYIERDTYRTLVQRLGQKQTRTVTAKTGGTREQIQHRAQQRVLNDDQQLRLGVIISRVFAALGQLAQHQDIEWAMAQNTFYVLQARPVTALPRYTENGVRAQREIWSNANFRDAVPMVIPFLQRDSLMRIINHTILAPFKDIGYEIKPGLAVAKYIKGRAYFNTSLYQWLLYDSCGMKPNDLNLFMGGHQPDIPLPEGSPYGGKSGIRRLVTMSKNIRLISRYQKQQQRFYAKVDQFAEGFDAMDFATLTDREFLDWVEKTENEILDFNDKYMALCGGVGPFIFAIKSLRPIFGEEAMGVVNALTSGQSDLPSANQGYQLLRLAEVARDDKAAKAFLTAPNFHAQDWKDLPEHSPFKQGFQQYLKEYGHRATYEIDCSKPRWREDPGYLLKNIAKTLDSADSKAQQRRQQQAYQDAMGRLKHTVGYVKRKWILSLIDQGVKGAQTRENAKSYAVKFSAMMRRLYLEAGRRLQIKGCITTADDVFYCAPAEVYAILRNYWNGNALSLLVAERRQAMEMMAKEKAPDVVINDEPIFEIAVTSGGANQYKGIGVSAGVAEGTAKIIRTPDDGDQLIPGDIMVAPSTDPAWTPLFIHAAGIVLETGGYTSHGSIVAREYGIPAVVNVAGALQLIKTGQTVVVNANNGSVTLK